MPDVPPLDLTRLKAAYAVESCSPTALIEALLPRLQASDQDAVWITRVEADVLRARARQLELQPAAGRGVDIVLDRERHAP